MTNKSKTKTVIPRGVRLNTPQDVRRLLSRLINQAMKEKINTDLLRAITYSANTLLKCFEVGELEERLRRVEEEILNQQGGEDSMALSFESRLAKLEKRTGTDRRVKMIFVGDDEITEDAEKRFHKANPGWGENDILMFVQFIEPSHKGNRATYDRLEEQGY